MRFILLFTIVLQILHKNTALIERTHRNGTTVASKSYVHPDLSKDYATSDDALDIFDPDEYAIPHDFQEKVNAFEGKLGILQQHLYHNSTTRIDVRFGRVESITLAYPILPGNGFGNRLLWSVSSSSSAEEEHEHDAAASSHGTTTAIAMSSYEWEELAIQAVKNWMMEYASDLDIHVETELFVKGSVRVAVHADGDMIQLSIPRLFKGIQVLGSRAMATIKLGNLINVGFEDWGNIPLNFSVRPTLSVEEAYDALLTLAVGHKLIRGKDNCEPELQILTLTPSSRTQFGEGYSHVLVWRVCPIFERQGVEVMEGLVDAHTGEIYSFIDLVHYLEAKGGVYPISNDKKDDSGREQPGWPMPYMYVGSETTDTGGNYFNTGSVSASFNGPYVSINDVCGSSSLSSAGGIDWGQSTGVNCITPGIGGDGNTHSSRTSFYELNKVMEIARSHLPNNAWLKRKLSTYVNINDSCNAYWWYGSINFYRQKSGCGNTGELAGVLIHEWGHGLDDNDVESTISKPSGEGIADIYAALRMNDSCIGRGFYRFRQGCTGVRQIDYLLKDSGKPKTFSNALEYCDDSVHCLGSVYAEAVWSLYKRILREEPYNYDENTALEVVTRLTFIAAGNIRTWYSGSPPYGGCGSASGYREYLAADDDNGNINDGTPHMYAIFKAFNDQEIACNSPTVKDSGCSGTPNTAPQVTITSGNMKSYISWSAVSGATNYQVFRTEGLQCNLGKVKLATTKSLSYIDTGLMNGREYYYIVIPKGPNDSCFGPASPCTSITIIAPPSAKPTPIPTRMPSPNPTAKPTNKPTMDILNWFEFMGNGWCFSAQNVYYDFLLFTTSTPTTARTCASTCPVTMAYRGFSVNYSSCYCWYDDGLVPSTSGGQVYSIWSGVGPISTISPYSGVTCYKSIHTTPPTPAPSAKPSQKPTQKPTKIPTRMPSEKPTQNPTKIPTRMPSEKPSPSPTQAPTFKPTPSPTNKPTPVPSAKPSQSPTQNPTKIPTRMPSESPSSSPTQAPTFNPTPLPTSKPTPVPSAKPSQSPTQNPTKIPTRMPSESPSSSPTQAQTFNPTPSPTNNPTFVECTLITAEEACLSNNCRWMPFFEKCRAIRASKVAKARRSSSKPSV